tara:strand:+ start:7864 stop:8778 length:915 start_codon:yes stop_codon:yes gene_type:complete
MKVFCLAPRENWICDRIADEWYKYCSEISTKNILDCDIVWLLAGWCWRNIHPDILKSKKVVVTVHHIVPDKFTSEKLEDFLARDSFVNMYHVPNMRTYNFISKITKKPISVVGYWFDKNKWFPEDKSFCRKALGLSSDSFIVGSFQRDTEGSDLETPKLEKGPDLFCNYVESIKRDNLHILLGGWRRQYVISRLEKNNIPYTYFELVNIEKLRQMYCALDLYVISSRYEGGPQSALEASGMCIPIVSRNVGMVPDIISKNCIFENLNPEFYPKKDDVSLNYEQSLNFEIGSHKENYIKMFQSVI